MIKKTENCSSSTIPRADGGNCKYFRKTRIDSVTGKSFTLIAEGKEKAGTLSGNCEEELPKKPVGRLSVNCRPSVDRQVTDS